MNQYIIAHVTISPSKHSGQPGGTAEVLPTGRIPLHRISSQVSQRGAEVLQLAAFSWCLHILTEPPVNQAHVFSLHLSPDH